jgi:alpha-N-arabinofuranosidase
VLLAMAGMSAIHARAQDMTVYDDALHNGWVSYGWATLNYGNAAPVHTGTSSIRVIARSYEALSLHHDPFSCGVYQSLSFWIYPEAAGRDAVQVQATAGGNAQPGVKLSFTPEQVGHWQRQSIPLVSLGVAGSTSLDGIRFQNVTAAPMTFYVDDVSLVALPPPALVAVTVDAGAAIRRIDGRIYGMNLAVWDSQLKRGDTAALLRTMQTGAVRFPGGSASDDYDWSTDRAVSKGTVPWPNSAGTFAQVTEAQHAQAYVTVNYGSGTPEEAAAWVAYYNASATGTTAIGVDAAGRDWKTSGYWAAMRGAQPLASDDGYNFLRVGHPAPYGIRYWEVGNECYGGWEYDRHGAPGSVLPGAPHDPVTYARAFADFYRKMLAVDPAVRVGAVAIRGEDKYGTKNHTVSNANEGGTMHKGWTPVVLATLKGLGVTPHFLIDHEYPQNERRESDPVLLQSGAIVKMDAASLRKMIGDYLGASGSGIELALTELNSVSSGPGKQSTSLVNGLFMADALGDVAETEFNACAWWAFRNGPGRKGNNDATLYGWRDYGDYGVVGPGDRSSGRWAETMYPAFYAAKLMTYWGHGGDTVISATSGYALLPVHAARLANGKLALLAINEHPVSDLKARIALSHFVPGGTVQVFSYGKKNDTDKLDITTGSASIPGGEFSYTFPAYSMTVLVISGL